MTLMDPEIVDPELVPEGQLYIIIFYRAFGSPTIYFGPFDSLDACFKWQEERHLSGMITPLNPPETDTGPLAAVWL